MSVRNTSVLVFLFILACGLCQTRATEPTIRTEALDQAQRLMGSTISGGQASPDYWAGFGPGTFMKLRTERDSSGQHYDSTVSYRIHERKGDQIVMEVETASGRKTSALERHSDAPGRALRIDDRDVGTVELALADGTVHSCDVFERTIERRPWCKSGEPDYYLTRITA